MAAEMKYGDYIKGGLEIVKANLVPSVVFALLMGLPIISLAGPIFVVNYMAAVKAAKHEGKPIQIGDLFNFENAVDKWVGLFIAAICIGIGNMCFVIPGLLAAGVFYFVGPILADKPGTPFVNALKGSLAFGKANLIPVTILAFVMGLVVFVGVIACFVGVLVTLPIAMAGGFLAYEDHKSAIEAAAAESGVQI